MFLCFAAVLPQPAIALEAVPSPSASELWESYPLHESPAPATNRDATPSPTPVTPPRRTEGSEQRTADDGGAVGIGLLLTLVVVAGGLGFAVLRRMRSRVPRPAPALAASPQAARGRRHDPPLLPPRRAAAGTAPGAAPPRRNAGGGAPVPLPPQPELEWTAEIEWRRSLGRPRFHVVARSSEMHTASIATSPPMEWPPTDGTSLEALAEAIRALEATLLAAGWIPTEPGTAWYAKRFAWQPVRVAPSSSVSTPGAALASTQAEPSPRSGR